MGDHSEDYALVFLRKLGICIQVPRTEDIGIDFYCAIEKQDGNVLTFHSPYIVQVGSEKTKRFNYGGVVKNKSGKVRWKKEEIPWLFSQELPLFLLLVNKKRQTFRLYQTSPMWLARNQFGLEELGQVNLIPEANHDPVKEVRFFDKKLDGVAGDGHRYDIPLFKPIVEMHITDLNDLLKINEARKRLSWAVDLEQRNIRYRGLFVHHSLWITSSETDIMPQPGYAFHYNKVPGKNTASQLQSIAPVIVTLALNYKAQKLNGELEKLKGICALLPENAVLDFAKQALPELFSINPTPPPP